jgi:CDP-diacylglycerol pyrophosphatase
VNHIVRFLVLLAIAYSLWPLLGHVVAADRDVLWQVVQACVTNHRITGAAFPCLEVNEGGGVADGFVVLRAPLARTHILIAPTTRIEGIEDTLLQSSNAPNFFEDAWEARQYVVGSAPRLLERDDIGLAINSMAGRNQDQLHIHVDCVKTKARRALQRADTQISFSRWSLFRLNPSAPQYLALKLLGPDLKDINVFKLAAEGLAVRTESLGNMTIAVIAASFSNGQDGFYLLATLAGPSPNVIKSESFLDHNCQ